MVESFQLLETLGVLATAIATILLVLMLWKAIKQMESTVELSKIQTNLRFRPWIGPSTGIKPLGLSSDGDKQQFEVVVKNFGEIVAEEVTVFCKKDTKEISKDEITSEGTEKFNLGPILPNMEKRYWIFVDVDLMNKVKNGEETLHTLVYFEYPVPAGKSGYGMISEYDNKKEIFIHKKMWVDNPKESTMQS